MRLSAMQDVLIAFVGTRRNSSSPLSCQDTAVVRERFDTVGKMQWLEGEGVLMPLVPLPIYCDFPVDCFSLTSMKKQRQIGQG